MSLLDTAIRVPQIYSANSLSKLIKFGKAIDALSARGGDDCPEYGMTGILNALDLAKEDSNIIVLTDASAKDKKGKRAVIRKAKKKRNSIHFFLSGNGCPADGFSPYLNVADKTHGTVVDQIDDFEAFVLFANEYRNSITSSSSSSATAGKKKKRGLYYCASFSTSVFTKSVDILFSSVNNGSVITIINPAGSIDRIKATGTIATYSNKKPLAGVYKICSTTKFQHSLSIISDLDFFVEYDISTSRTSLPTPGKYVN